MAAVMMKLSRKNLHDIETINKIKDWNDVFDVYFETCEIVIIERYRPEWTIHKG